MDVGVFVIERFNISSNIPSPSNNPLSFCYTWCSISSTSSIVYSPPDLSFADTIKQSNVSSARQMPSVVSEPPLPNSCNYPSINHFVQPPNSNPLDRNQHLETSR
ncbi:hypothetical protein EWB00_003004 [Schistosoma japonicum]|uniref:Uncharacterized protein n=1 Tax=Schistosoma japonicum TaxID=6182 RepID=A0A4Z2DB59_SCHJA|nr:hypothetical protein EWB00_003004 [Schistosoma japonicum]